MTLKECIVGILTDHSCLTATELSSFIRRKYGELHKPASISGILRTMYAKGQVASSKNLKGSTVYWLTDKGKTEIPLDKLKAVI